MILVLGADAPVGAVVAAELEARGAPVRALPGLPDLLALSNEMRGIERLYLEQTDEPAREVDALSIAEQCGAYHVVRLGPADDEVTEHLQLSSLRWTLLETADPKAVDAREVGELAARALSEEGHENTRYRLGGDDRADLPGA